MWRPQHKVTYKALSTLHKVVRHISTFTLQLHSGCLDLVQLEYVSKSMSLVLAQGCVSQTF